jgi:hypothetical protein
MDNLQSGKHLQRLLQPFHQPSESATQDRSENRRR